MQEAFIIARALTRAFSHKIRTPLATALNELEYLVSLVPQGECDRAKEACKKITHVISSISRLAADNIEKKSVALSELLEVQSLDFLNSAEVDPKALEIKIDIDKELLARSISLLNKALLSIKDESKDSINIKIETDASKEIKLAWNFKAIKELNSYRGQYSLLSDLLCLGLGQDNFELPLAEAIILGHDFKLEIETEPEFKAVLYLH